MLGLSATIERPDGLTKVINWYMGDLLYHTTRKNQLHVNVVVKNYKCEKYSENFPLNRMKKIKIPQAISQVVEDNERNEMIINLVEKMNKNQKRNIIILSDRREHCNILFEKLKNKNYNCGLYIGGMNKEELSNSEKTDIIISTFALSNEGLDIPKLDSLILATPKSNIIQSVGRILREANSENRNIVNNPIIYDIIDEWGVFKIQFFKRKKYYKDTGFTIINDDNYENNTYEKNNNNFLFQND